MPCSMTFGRPVEVVGWASVFLLAYHNATTILRGQTIKPFAHPTRLKGKTMDRVEIETQLMQEIRRLPLDKAEEILDFALFLRSRDQDGHRAASKQRPLGILKGQASCHIAEDFSISDEELLDS